MRMGRLFVAGLIVLISAGLLIGGWHHVRATTAQQIVENLYRYKVEVFDDITAKTPALVFYARSITFTKIYNGLNGYTWNGYLIESEDPIEVEDVWNPASKLITRFLAGPYLKTDNWSSPLFTTKIVVTDLAYGETEFSNSKYQVLLNPELLRNDRVYNK